MIGVTMKFILLLLTLSISLSTLSKEKCDFDFKNYCATVKFAKTPSRSYSSDFKLTFIDKATKKAVIPKEKVMSYLWMKMKNGHEHGSSPVKITQVKDHYLVKDVWFVMIGKWELFVQLKENGMVTEKKLKIVSIQK
jgi:hypothetical protein